MCICDNSFKLVNNVKLVDIKSNFTAKGRCLESGNLQVKLRYRNNEFIYPDEFICEVTLIWVKLSCNCKLLCTVRLKAEA